MTTDPMLCLKDLAIELEIARGHSIDLVAGLTREQINWRPNANSSAIGWHLGHQAAVNHYMVRNLTAAEPPIDRALDALFDSATVEPDRSPLPPLSSILDYRYAVAASTKVTIDRIIERSVQSPEQLTAVALGLLSSLVNHEYQHAAWIGEVRDSMIAAPRPIPRSDHLSSVDGYWMIQAHSVLEP